MSGRQDNVTPLGATALGESDAPTQGASPPEKTRARDLGAGGLDLERYVPRRQNRWLELDEEDEADHVEQAGRDSPPPPDDQDQSRVVVLRPVAARPSRGLWRRGSQGFVISMFAHLLAAVALAVTVMEATRLTAVSVVTVTTEAEAPPELTTLKLTTSAPADMSVREYTAATTPDAIDPGDSSSVLQTISALSNKGNEPARHSPIGDVQGLFAGHGRGLAAGGEGKSGAEFFGVQASGRRFVFVVDSSRSMTGRKWIKACRELIKAVEGLSPDQSFYVIFFDHDVHAMFDQKKPEREMLPATPQNAKRLKRWLISIKFGNATKPFGSVKWAMSLNPDAVFLLSDGEFVDPTRDFLLAENRVMDDDEGIRPKVTVHTIGFHSMACEAVLKPIAMENGGVYRFVPDPRVEKHIRRRTARGR